MLATPFSQISDNLSEAGLLTGEQFDELRSQIFPKCRDWNILLPELVFRKWLTPYQAYILSKGKGRDLKLGSYVLKEPLGEGGMGRIFRAEHAKLRTPAALKILRKSQAKNPVAMSRFLREIRALASLRHPHIVHALDADVAGGRIFCVMEYVPGFDLGQLVRQQGVLSWDMAARYAFQIAIALQYVSAAGLIHRDIKPSNIQVTQDGQNVKLLDLGLARFERWDLNDDDGGVTQMGMMIGTPNYISPEQIRDSRSADIRSDLYSLGCTLYYTLTGRPPFESGDVVTALQKQLSEDAIPAEKLRPDLPAPLGAVIRVLMQKKPRDRYQHPGELVEALRPFVTPSGDTLSDAASTTCSGLPVYHPDAVAHSRTDEIPLKALRLVNHRSPEVMSRREQVYHLLGKLHWLIAFLIAGLAMVLVIRAL
ncbi:serine/threonine protein kinase [Zavarzinella formosa]|uniref:serine/threonine protein kinase n=1 Tax=Zavarzinella formosa TaxID=360055 RepID=UPI00069790C3|nr:serine/threonine-protein kinase [Zavarzinella formosa]